MAKKENTKLREWQNRASQGGVCGKCLREVGYLTVDHIVPVAFLEQFDDTGMAKFEDEENFMMLCRPCNSFKSFRFDRSNPKTKEIMLKYLI